MVTNQTKLFPLKYESETNNLLHYFLTNIPVQWDIFVYTDLLLCLLDLLPFIDYDGFCEQLVLVHVLDLLVDSFYFFYALLQIRSLGLLRSRFGSLPKKFNSQLIPTDNSDGNKKKGLKASLSRRLGQV